MYHGLRSKIKLVSSGEYDANELRDEIEYAYNTGDISGHEYDSLMALLNDWLY